jgi:hypothetical protein
MIDTWANMHVDKDMTPLDMTIDYKVSSFLHLYNDFGIIQLVLHVRVIIFL